MTQYALRSKVDTLIWYLKRPHLYREMVRKVTSGRISSARSKRLGEEAKNRGRAWCAERAASAAAVMNTLGLPAEVKTVSEIHPEEWQRAESSVRNCPIKMGGPAEVDVLHHLCRYLKVERVVETGVASGWSSLAILLALAGRDGCRLFSIDMPYAKLENEDWVGCAVPTTLRGQWTLLRKADREGIPEALRALGTIDLAHYDSDKSRDGRTFGYRALWQALRVGGVLMSDDIEDNDAFAEFARSVAREPLVVQKKPGNYAGVLVK